LSILLGSAFEIIPGIWTLCQMRLVCSIVKSLLRFWHILSSKIWLLNSVGHGYQNIWRCHSISLQHIMSLNKSSGRLTRFLLGTTGRELVKTLCELRYCSIHVPVFICIYILMSSCIIAARNLNHLIVLLFLSKVWVHLILQIMIHLGVLINRSKSFLHVIKAMLFRKYRVQSRIPVWWLLLLSSLECRNRWLHTNVWLLFLLLNVIHLIIGCLMHPILVHNLLRLGDILLWLDDRHIYVHLFALFVQIRRRYLFGEVLGMIRTNWLLLFLRIIGDGEVLIWLLLLMKVLIVFALSILFLILGLLLNLAEVWKFLFVVLNKLLIIAIPLPNFLNLVWVNLHMIQNNWLDIVVVFLHDIFV